MKKFLKIIVVVIVLAAVLLPLEHYYCDNIYALAAFSKAPVIEVDKNVYRCAKDDYKDFIEYMQSEGWSYVTQFGSVHFFEKGDKIVGCDLSIKSFMPNGPWRNAARYRLSELMNKEGERK